MTLLMEVIMPHRYEERIEVKINDTVIGEVYKSSHGVWVAEPNFCLYSKSFLSEDAAKEALVKKAIEFYEGKDTNFHH